MNLATLTHANLKEPVDVDLDLIGAWWFSPGHKSTILMLIGGGCVPVLEGREKISALKQNTKNEKGEKNNGT